MADTLLIDGHDVSTLTGAKLVGFIDGIRSPGTKRVQPDVIPGAPGRQGGPSPVDYYIITFTLWIQGSSSAVWNAALSSIGALIAGDAAGGIVALTRRLDAVGGGYDEHTAPGEYITGLNPQRINPRTSKTVLQYYQDAGLWSGDGGATYTLR